MIFLTLFESRICFFAFELVEPEGDTVFGGAVFHPFPRFDTNLATA